MAKIMLVEDDANLQSIYGDRLTAEGHIIISARDGEEALSLAMKEKPDLIISDIMMPKISGFDMLDILRTTPETKNIKIIMMTALSQAEDKERADKLGADKYLVKSQVTLDDVARVVNETIKELPKQSPDQASASPASPAPSSATAATPMPEPTIVNEPVVSAPEPAATPTNDLPVVQDPPADPPVAADSPAVDPVPPISPVSDPIQDVARSFPDAPTSETTPITVVNTSSTETEATNDSVPSATEQAAISSQIDDFLAKNLPDTPTHAADEDAVKSQPSEETPAGDASAAPADEPEAEFVPPNEDGIMPPPVLTATPPVADLAQPAPTAESPASVNETVPPTEEPEPTPAETTPSAPETPASQPAGEKVIQPLGDLSNPKPNIMDLYDKEVAKEIADAPVPAPPTGTVIYGPTPEPTTQEQPPAPSDPHAIAL